MASWKTPSDMKFLKSDEWVRIEGETATIGVSDFAQDQLNDIVYVELPEVGAELAKGTAFGVVESVKAASDVYMPISGVVTEVNSALNSQHELINADPYEKGWLIKVKVTGDTDNPALMDAQAYAAYCETR